MDDIFSNLKVVTVDGSQQLEFSGLPKAISLSRFKSLVALRVNHVERRIVNADSIELMAFGEQMTDGTRSLASYGIEDEGIITRVEHVPAGNRYQSSSRATSVADNVQDNTRPPPYGLSGENDTNMQGPKFKNLFIKADHRTYTLNEVPAYSTVEDLFAMMKNKTGLDEASTMLIFGTKQLARGKGLTLMDYGLQNDSTLISVVKLPGGFRKLADILSRNELQKPYGCS